MRCLFFVFFLVAIACKPENNVSGQVTYDSTKYDGLHMFFHMYCERPKSGVYLSRNGAFLLTICNYSRYRNYKDWWLRRYSDEYPEGRRQVIYYEVIDLDASFKPKIVGKLHFLYKEDLEITHYVSDTTRKGFYFYVTDMTQHKSRGFVGIVIKKAVASSIIDSLCDMKKRGFNEGRCLYDEYVEIIETPYRIITDEEVNDVKTDDKRDDFIEHIKPIMPSSEFWK